MWRYNRASTGLWKSHRLPGSWGFQVSIKWAHDCGKAVSCQPYTPVIFSLRKYSWYSFKLRGRVDPKVTVRPGILCQRKISMTQSGTEPHVPEQFLHNNKIIKSFTLYKIVRFIFVRLKYFVICYVTCPHDYTTSLYFC